MMADRTFSFLLLLIYLLIIMTFSYFFREKFVVENRVIMKPTFLSFSQWLIHQTEFYHENTLDDTTSIKNWITQMMTHYFGADGCPYEIIDVRLSPQKKQTVIVEIIETNTREMRRFEVIFAPLHSRRVGNESTMWKVYQINPIESIVADREITNTSSWLSSVFIDKIDLIKNK
jgi:hypothetical protein